MSKDLKSGDVVRLNSGGPKMTVGAIFTGSDSANCQWFDLGRLGEKTFLLTSLTLVKDEKDE